MIYDGAGGATDGFLQQYNYRLAMSSLQRG